jgi:hypothetical protein
VVVDGFVARQQAPEAVEQVFEPEHRADALVERVFVQDQNGGFPGDQCDNVTPDCSTGWHFIAM